MTGPSTRPLTAADERLLMVATLGNLNWAADRFTMRDVTDRPEFAHYTRLGPGRGDLGFVAEDGDRPIGVVWALFLPSDDGGFGFVDSLTPELSLWVHADDRGRGVGRHLLQSLKTEAARRGISGISLSVERGNVARHLYESEGFQAVPGRESDGVLVWTP